MKVSFPSSLAPRYRRGLAALIALMLLMAGLSVLLSRVSLPEPWVVALLERVGTSQGLAVEASAVTWTRWNRLVFHEAEVLYQGEAEGPFPGEWRAQVGRAEIQISASDVLPWLAPGDSRRVRLFHVRPVSGGAVPGWEEALISEADLRWEGGAVVVERVEFTGPWGSGRAEGRWDGEGVQARVWLMADDWGAWASLLGLETGLPIDGPFQVELALQGALSAPELQWQVTAPELYWSGEPWGTGPYRITGLAARGRWDGADRLLVDHLAALLHEATADPQGTPRRVQASGTVVASSGMQLDVELEGVQLPADVPVVAQWGVKGSARLEGALSGDWTSPQFRGRVQLGPGQFWQQPVDRVQATLTLTPKDLWVEESEIAQGGALYRLSGRVVFPVALPPEERHPEGRIAGEARGGLEGENGALDLTLVSEGGRAETLLEVLGWPHLSLTGTVDGTLRFRGPFHSLESEGALTLSAGSGWSQPFDEISGTYRWDREVLHLADGVFRLGGGQGSFSGTVDAQGRLHLEVEATGMPLEQLETIRRASRGLLAGRVDFRGHVGGDLAQPEWEGYVQGRRLQLGRLHFERGGGELALSRGAWEVRDLAFQRPSGAHYVVSGWVDASKEFPPLVHLLVDVEDEGLEEALSLMGIRLAYPLVSGRVAGRALLIGELAQPDGEIFLDVTDAYLAGRPTGLHVEMEVAGGQVRVRELRLGSGSTEGHRG